MGLNPNRIYIPNSDTFVEAHSLTDQPWGDSYVGHTEVHDWYQANLIPGGARYLPENNSQGSREPVRTVLGNAAPNSLLAGYTIRPDEAGAAYFPSRVARRTLGDQTITAVDTAAGRISSSVGRMSWVIWSVTNELNRVFARLPAEDQAGFRSSRLPDHATGEVGSELPDLFGSEDQPVI